MAMKFSFQTVCLILFVTFAHLVAISVISSRTRDADESFTGIGIDAFLEEGSESLNPDWPEESGSRDEATVPSNPLREEPGDISLAEAEAEAEVPAVEATDSLSREGSLFAERASSPDAGTSGASGAALKIARPVDVAENDPERSADGSPGDDSSGSEHGIREIRPIPRS